MSKERGVDGLTAQQRAFLENYKAVGFDPSKRKDALVKAGYSEKQAISRGLEIERGIKVWVITALRRQNITPDRLSTGLSQLLMDPDPAIRARAVEMGFKLYDAFPDKKVKIQAEMSRHIEVDFETLRLAEEVSGEKIIDVEPVSADNERQEQDLLGPL